MYRLHLQCRSSRVRYQQKSMWRADSVATRLQTTRIEWFRGWYGSRSTYDKSVRGLLLFLRKVPAVTPSSRLWQKLCRGWVGLAAESKTILSSSFNNSFNWSQGFLTSSAFNQGTCPVLLYKQKKKMGDYRLLISACSSTWTPELPDTFRLNSCTNIVSLSPTFALVFCSKIEAIYSSETSVDFHRTV
jgi:hypothetical protein